MLCRRDTDTRNPIMHRYLRLDHSQTTFHKTKACFFDYKANNIKSIDKILMPLRHVTEKLSLNNNKLINF
jgi:hypothetical protein